jgi:GTP-binding protein EngB required for normal cell division
MPNSRIRLNDNHRNTLLAGFKYIDRLLAEAVGGLTAVENGAIFSPVAPDATAVQRKIISDQASSLRRVFRAALDACDIPVRPPTIGGLRNLRSALIFIDIAIEELGPKHLNGYGNIDAETAAQIEALQAQMRTRLGELRRYVDSGLGGDLSARLARLDQTIGEVLLLRELERMITNYGLVELRQQLTMLLERMEVNMWTVAFVGRVSSGKSSLLNFLLNTDALPSGVTPVTAVPIRIIPGSPASAVVSFATGKPERVPALRLREFASEEHNPGNERHVTDVLLELPAPRLATDICFVDTPGLGSLATAGAAQTLAFLPRCDLGIFLLDSGSTVTEEDLQVVRSLLEGGAEVLVVLSKADLLTPDDLGKLLGYVRKQLAEALSHEVSVEPISVAPGHSALADVWFDTMLLPRRDNHRELAAITLRRKAGALRESVISALDARRGVASKDQSTTDDQAAFGLARALFESNRRRLYDLALQATPRADAVLEQAADRIADKMPNCDTEELGAALACELSVAAANLADRFEELLRESRRAAEEALKASDEFAQGIFSARPYSRPLFDPAPVLASARLPDSWLRWPFATARRASLRRQLRSRFVPALENALPAYAHALVGWGQHYLDDIAVQFNAHAGLAESRTLAPEDRDNSDELGSDLELLRAWNSQAPVAV